MISRAVRHGEREEVGETVDVRGDEHDIISLSNSSYVDATNVGSKEGILVDIELFIVVYLVKFTTFYATLFYALLIMNRGKQLFIPLDYGFAVSKSLVEVNKSRICSPIQI